MKKLIFLLVSLFIHSCSNNKTVKTNNIDSLQNSLDTIIVRTDSTIVSNQVYYATYYANDYFIIRNQNKDTLFISNNLGPDFEFNDFDKDGNKDLVINYISSNDLLLFDIQSNTFKLVENITNFPQSIKI